MSHLAACQDNRGKKSETGYLGLSGMNSDPAARIAPMTHCKKSGIRHDLSESMKEQK
jgi:hypothetical protein